MRFLLGATLLTVASAFTLQPNVAISKVAQPAKAESLAHRSRKATIVMDGKANGECET